ncbi:hypothetical protein EIL87_03030 [Saccharopolyspora rhizosphaerae]|uniref:Uncharacterized protein n=1 Tax=Saccharopolyspora rhizosphaerae TaxID=2492662 RepID=A0A426K3A7_9PSEU|nr:hypothetical protein [Saccharopolyspora rhizosphaerae]RRO19966.1 hypothetical protein EIL87_03030 [Saccharopolyspora rhizosphaerae]
MSSVDHSIVVPPRAAVPLFTRAEARAQRLSDHHIRRHFQRVAHGIYAVWDAAVTHELWCQALAVVLPADAIITGRSAANLYGLALPTIPSRCS